MFQPTLAFWFSLLPLPIIWFLNLIVLRRMYQVHKLARGRQIKRPKIYINGSIINLISLFFVILPALIEWRIFVLNPYWIIVYMAAGIMNIIGLSMVSRGLEIESASLKHKKRRTRKTKPASKRSATGRKSLTVT